MQVLKQTSLVLGWWVCAWRQAGRDCPPLQPLPFFTLHSPCTLTKTHLTADRPGEQGSGLPAVF